MGDDMEGAMQHAPQSLRQFMVVLARSQNLKLQIIHYLHFTGLVPVILKSGTNNYCNVYLLWKVNPFTECSYLPAWFLFFRDAFFQTVYKLRRL